MILMQKPKEDIVLENSRNRKVQRSTSPRREDDVRTLCFLHAALFGKLTMAMEQKTDREASSLGENAQDKSPSRRPFTRSQTGYISKPRRRDDSPPVAVTRRTSPSRKKRKPSVKPPSEESYLDAPQGQNTSDPPSKRRAYEATTVHSDITVHPPTCFQLSLVPGSSSSTTSSTADMSPDRRGPKPRVILPIPIPNLTKKSRGRRVPTKVGTGFASDADPKDTRLYVCKVESCRKCFHRGEHLKRHIRSIHTHDKREFELECFHHWHSLTTLFKYLAFACLHAGCGKRFNRHDNLLQHLKVHRDFTPPPSAAFVENTGSPLQKHWSLTPSPPPEQRYSPEAYEVSIIHARRAAAFRRQPSYVDYDHTSYGSTSEPTRLITNMAVSSLRTEIPPSPI
jgi:Zinc finger, C2H2 type